VLENCEAVLTQNALGDARFSEHSSVMGLKLISILCVPLICRGNIKGVIYVENRVQKGVFTQNNLELLTAIAANAGVALENAQLFCDLQGQLQTLNLLYEISADLTSRLNLEQLLTATLQRVKDVLAAPAASILTVEGEELVFQVALGEKAEVIKPFNIPIDQGIAGWVVQNAEGVIVNDAGNDARFYSQSDAKSGFITQSIIAAPLLVKDRAIGVIELFNKPGGFSENDLGLLTAIASTAAIAIDNARLYQAAVDKGRMERELQMALTVQTGLLPSKIPQFAGWDFAAHWKPAREVSGDYYDFIYLDSAGHTLFNNEPSLGLVIADVTDKGMPAALFMAFTRSIIRASVHQADSPAEGITHANHLICDESTRGLFVTVFYAQLNPTTGQLNYVNAGHNPPLHYCAARGTLQRLMPTGISVGIVNDFIFKQDILTLEPGDFLLCYTDGITEAIDPEEQAFGIPRLEGVALAHRDETANELAISVLQAVSEFCGSNKQFDDMTIMVVKRT
jgi:serine phosphatase RsbU (regulator of sigma subunit)